MAPASPYSLKDAPALIERLLPVQKLSAESYKEQMAVHGKTLTALGSFWKGRKPLILAKACILGSLLPATGNPAKDLAVFEMLMGMDDESFLQRFATKPKPRDILTRVEIGRIRDYFTVDPDESLPPTAPVHWPDKDGPKVSWRSDVSSAERAALESQAILLNSYRQRVDLAKRPEEVEQSVFDHIWESINAHLGTDATSFPDLVSQLGIMRFGRRPKVADTFCGSGQIAFEAARLGCDVDASDLNPIACLLTWASFNIVGGPAHVRADLAREQREAFEAMQAEVDSLGVENDGSGWRAKTFLYCVEARCPQSGWSVPLLPTLVISKSHRVVAELAPDAENKRYDILIRTGVDEARMKLAEEGTVQREGRFGDAYLVHEVDHVTYKTRISTLRGDYEQADGTIGNRLRPWKVTDVTPSPDDLLQERLYCVQWMRPKGKLDEYEFRTVTAADLERERRVNEYVIEHLPGWQAQGYAPDMRIEVGGPPRYQGLDLIRARGWTHWNHVFNPRQLMIGALIRKHLTARLAPSFLQSLSSNSRLSQWSSADGGGGAVKQTFANQALSTLFNYGCRGSAYAASLLLQTYKGFPIDECVEYRVRATPADQVDSVSDVYITDPPYGDAIKYEEILDFFIAWLRKAPPVEFQEWVWDSRRSLAVKGEDEGFRRSMVTAYRAMADHMPDNGMQIIMFTHQSGAIWADMANIVWAAGLRVTAAWYVVTETDSALREGSFVKGTVLLVCRKRDGASKTTRDDLGWELQEEVAAQVEQLIGLNQEAKPLYRDANVFEDADIQMAGYAAALRVLTRYSTIDGRDMPSEAIRPRVKGTATFVDDLIRFAVDTANQCLVPQGIPKAHWDRMTSAERFYLKMLDMESRGAKTLDNYQNFAKAFKVRDFKSFMASHKANSARLKSSVEFGRSEMNEASELHESVLRAVLYGLMELEKNVDGDEVLAHLTLNVPNYYGDMTQRDLVTELADYLAARLDTLRPEEASNARVLRELVRNQRLG